MDTIKVQPISKNENGFLKDNINNLQIICEEVSILGVFQIIDENNDILEENKKKLREMKISLIKWDMF